MAQILFGGEWFKQTSPRALYEAEYEKIIEQLGHLLFPGYTVTPFRVTVESELGSVQADLALIREDYGEWWVVEVELASHSLHGHVIPQVTKLLTGQYGEKQASYLAKNNPRLDSNRLKDMLKGNTPNVLVIVNSSDQSWQESIEATGARLATFEMYRSDRTDRAFWIEGLPLIAKKGTLISKCEREKTVPSMLRVLAPGSLPFQHGDTVSIAYEDSQTYWTRCDSAERVWLVASGPFPLLGDGPFLLHNRGETLELVAEK